VSVGRRRLRARKRDGSAHDELAIELTFLPARRKGIDVTFEWGEVERLIERLDADLASEHGLGPLAASMLRHARKPVPNSLLREHRAAATANLVAPALLTRIRSAYDGPLLVLKGPEVARRYPDRARRFSDLDLLAGDADQAQAALLASGFKLHECEWPPQGYDDRRRPHFHLHPLEWPGLALRIEVHRSVNWPEACNPPANAALFEAAVPASIGVDGLLTPHPNHHALLIAAHGWGKLPMLRDLVDLMVFVEDDQREELQRIARTWKFERAWAASLALAEWRLTGRPEPGFVRLWARYLRGLREPTVLEMHLHEWSSPFWLVPARKAVHRAGIAIARDVRPWPDQPWSEKMRRIALAFLNPLSPKSQHDRRWGLGRWRQHRVRG